MVSRGHMYNPSAGLQKEFASACLSLLPSTPLTGPLEATLYFFFSRPKNHYGTGKNSDVLKPLTAGNWHHKRKGKNVRFMISCQRLLEFTFFFHLFLDAYNLLYHLCHLYSQVLYLLTID
jgi:hypothetical protein